MHNVDDWKVKARVEVKLERKRYMFVSLSHVFVSARSLKRHANIVLIFGYIS